eukprot:gene19086-biopygen19020
MLPAAPLPRLPQWENKATLHLPRAASCAVLEWNPTLTVRAWTTGDPRGPTGAVYARARKSVSACTRTCVRVCTRACAL